MGFLDPETRIRGPVWGRGNPKWKRQTAEMSQKNTQNIESLFRKIPAPIKIKLALLPPPLSIKPQHPPPPPKTQNFMGMGVFQKKEPKNARRP